MLAKIENVIIDLEKVAIVGKMNKTTNSKTFSVTFIDNSKTIFAWVTKNFIGEWTNQVELLEEEFEIKPEIIRNSLVEYHKLHGPKIIIIA